MIRRHRRRTTDAPFDHGEPIKGIKTLPFAILAVSLASTLLPFQRTPIHAVLVALPPLKSDPDFDPSVAIVNRVNISKVGEIAFNGKTVSANHFADLLYQSRGINPEPTTIFAPHRLASYDTSARVLNIIIASGVTKFCFADLQNYRDFGKDNSMVNPTLTAPALAAQSKTLLLQSSLYLDTPTPTPPPPPKTSTYSPPPGPPPRPEKLDNECEALAQIP